MSSVVSLLYIPHGVDIIIIETDSLSHRIEVGLATTSMHREAISDIYFERSTTVNKVLSIPCVLTYYDASCMKYGTLYGNLSCKFTLCHAICQ